MSPATPSPSPLVRPAELDGSRPLPAPDGHTEAELAALLGLLTAARPRVHTITLGHSRDDASRAATEAFAEAWRDRGGSVLAVTDWPEQAASWLRPARRFTALAPDAWVVAAAPLGWVQMARRLRQSTAWAPDRTFGFAALAEPRAIALAGPDTLHGLRGATADGSAWEVRHGRLTTRLPQNGNTR
ncbi:hypothetical protein [Streptomyces sp. CBMA123]|uniref:hypothetical protein n=1 Tax=Streptomyces sp. CBMA123 TaxID=1896313 RepID=UPI001661FF15|nr:hypothetical protein [Streptomyces sp. CBMA123]MBD0695500.1 hypothetical protein [Streptomyces sp. CBMA123]